MISAETGRFLTRPSNGFWPVVPWQILMVLWADDAVESRTDGPPEGHSVVGNVH